MDINKIPNFIADEIVQGLIDDMQLGQIVDENDDDLRYLFEKKVDEFKGLKVYIYSNEHPPPHFHILHQGINAQFTIKDCTPLNENQLSSYNNNIKKWYKKNRELLISIWNDTRPSDCPVGNFEE